MLGFILSISVSTVSAQELDKYNGLLITSSSDADSIFLVLHGRRSSIPDKETYLRLFVDKVSKTSDLLMDKIPLGPPISKNAMLVYGGGSIYLISNNTKQGIGSSAAFNRYFKGKAIEIPQIVIDYIPNGPLID
jgi:hypothetical protein